MRTHFRSFAPVLTASAMLACTVALSVAPGTAAAQDASIVYRLGRDTVAVERFSRSAGRMVGEMVQRSGAAVQRLQYEITLGADGRPTAAVFRRLQADGTPVAAGAREARFRFTGATTTRELLFADSVQTREFPVGNAMPSFPTFVYGPFELMASLRRGGAATDSIPALGLGGAIAFTGLTGLGGDSARVRGGAYAMVLKFDANSRLQSVDGFLTTNKVNGTRVNAALDIAALARTMRPTGTLSGRDVARGAFGTGGIVLVDYGRPQVRERTVWGGTLVPYDSVWRAGANDATHLFTTRTLTFGDVVVPPGMYTLWVQHTRQGTFLIVNKQTGQWGTAYDRVQDLGRVAMQLAPAPEHVEEFTITVRSLGGNRGAIDLAWGPSVATANFTASAPRLP